VTLAATASSCLITQPVHFDEPANTPPAISENGLLPLNSLIHYPTDVVVSTGDAGTSSDPDVTLSVTVYDADVDQTLHFAALVDMSPVPCVGCNGDLAPVTGMTGRERRPLQVTIGHALLSSGVPSCHRITLIVTGAFESGSATPRDPVGDSATATWWVIVQPHTGDAVEMANCPQ
jgi:hypothetical protein